MKDSFVRALFYDEPAGTFSEGHPLRYTPDLTCAQPGPDSGYWRYDIADHDRLTWSETVHELFGLPAGAPVDRDWADAHYSDRSRLVLERVRHFGLNHKFGFILDAEITPEGAGNRWIRVLAVPILADGRVVGLHGLKRSL